MLYQRTEIGSDFHLFRSPEIEFNRNFYIRIFHGKSNDIIMIMDPGGASDREGMLSAFSSLALDPKDLDLIFLSHQDPDVSGNVKYLLNHSRAKLIASWDTWRLVRSEGLSPARFFPADGHLWQDMEIGLTKVRLIPARFCHSPGAIMIFDIKLGILFSGDLFSGLNISGDSEMVFSDDLTWSGIETFHRIYMPSSHALSKTLKYVEALMPGLQTIAPQHGKLVSGTYISEFIMKLKQLSVGSKGDEEASGQDEKWIELFNSILSKSRKKLSNYTNDFVAECFSPAGEFAPILEFHENHVIGIRIPARLALKQGFHLMREKLDPVSYTLLKEITISGLKEINEDVPEYLHSEREEKYLDRLFFDENEE